MPADIAVAGTVRGIAIAGRTNSKRIRINPSVRVGGRDRRNLLDSTSGRFVPGFQESSALGMEPPLAARILPIGMFNGCRTHVLAGFGEQ
jgi:hypothetical protein